MKKILMGLVMAMLLVPFAVKAEGKVKIYLFRGEGCPHCEEALEFFDGLSDEDKNKFDLVQYEVWYDEENNELMKKVAEKLDEEVSGVPFIVVGDQAFHGFTESIGEKILSTVDKYYEEENFIDIVTATDYKASKKDNKDAIIVGVFVAAVVVGVGLVVLARKEM